MKLILTHEHPDFDALAGLSLAQLAHPGARAAIDSDLPDTVKAFLHLYRDRLGLLDLDDIEPQEVTELIVVDTNDPRRLGRFADVVRRVPVTLYDHHPRHDGEIAAAHGVQEQVGSTATLLTRHLQASSIPIPAAIASLALLAIHEDTGSLSFDLTAADDYEAAAHLMRSGASLEVVREFHSDSYDRQQRELLQEALAHAHLVRVGGHEVAVAAFERQRYVRSAAGACNSLLSLHSADAAVLAVRMEGKTLVFARALRAFDVGAALGEAFDGGGHPGAAFARTEARPEAAARRAVAALGRHVRPVLTAGRFMSSPVKTVAASATIGQAQQLLVQYGHNGAPVVDDDGRVVGVVSRRDLERALRHELARSPVRGFMTQEVISADRDATLTQLERLVEEHNIGRIPILHDDRLVGIVTRSDLLAAHHPGLPEDEALRVRERLPSEALRLVARAAEMLVGDQLGSGALYLVGGTVRDALLGRALADLDLAVEGVPAEALVTRLQRELGGTMTFHAAFGTSTLTLPSGLTVDIAGAREEYYSGPGVLPDVTPAPIRKDLGRRDFTVNAMAVRLAPEPLALLDPYDGLADLRRRTLRILHPLSFIEDPTRILRGARLAGRLGFTFANSTGEKAREALRPGLLERVTRARLRSELELTFAEPRVAPALEVLASLGALETVYGLSWDESLCRRLDELRGSEGVPDLAYLLALLARDSDERSERHVDSFHWPRKLLAARERIRHAEAEDWVDDETLDEADEAERAVISALSPALESRLLAFQNLPRRRKLRGSDVLELGLPPGPQVGQILGEVADARRHGRVKSFDDELELARHRVAEALEERARE